MSDKEEELRVAASGGRLDDVKRLVEKEGVNPNYNNGRALCFAACNGHTTVVDYLLKKNVSTEGRYGGDTPLIDAAQCNHLEVVRLLLDANADLNAKNNDDKTALDLAAEKKHNDVAQLLRDHAQRKLTKTKLLAALHETRIQDAITLIKSTTVDVNLRDGNYVPLLQLVVDTGDMALLQTLLSKPNLDVNATDKEERTALTRAIAKSNVAAVFALLKVNPLIRLVDNEGLVIETDVLGSLLLHAASTNDASNVDNLLRAGVRPSTINKDGATALHVAAANGYDTIAALLLAKD
ncbi:hypothetical protein SDRG_15797, partial [Saprolegnia diclina VS20]